MKKEDLFKAIGDVDDAIALLGNDLLSCCEFIHKEKDDIVVNSFNQPQYQSTYQDALHDADLQALIAEVTVPEP